MTQQATITDELAFSQPYGEQEKGGVSGNPRKFRHSALWNFLGGWSAA